MEYSRPFFIFRRRLAKTVLRIFGWKFRGQDPPTSKRHLIFINDSKGALAKKQHLWMRHLTAAASYFIELGDRTGFEDKINQHATILVKWRDDIDKNELEWLLILARETDSRISACAWDSTHKAIKFHSQFTPSPYPERDIRYLERFFVYFRKI